MQLSFITKQQRAYGNITHFYTVDQFNEMTECSRLKTVSEMPYLNSRIQNTVSARRQIFLKKNSASRRMDVF
ncbi:hypothetical protein V8C34DRAFT_295597 [Trichoderma compactum]